MRQHAQGLACIMVLLHAGQKVLALRVVTQAERGRCGQGPLAVRVAAFFPCGAQPCATRCLAACDQAGGCGERLSAGEAVDTMAFREQHEAEHLAHTGDGVQQRQGVGIVRRGGCAERERQVFAPRILRGEERQVARDGLWPRRRGTACGHPVAMGLGGHLLAALGPGVWALGSVHMGQACSACAPQVGAAPQPSTGGAQRSRRDRGLWEQTASQQGGTLVRIALVGFGLPAVHGLHREGMPQDEGHACVRPAVGEPGPGAETLDGHNQAIPRGGHGLEEGCRRRLHRAVQQDCAILAQDTDVHGAGMQVDPAGKRVLMGVEAHGGLLLVRE